MCVCVCFLIPKNPLWCLYLGFNFFFLLHIEKGGGGEGSCGSWGEKIVSHGSFLFFTLIFCEGNFIKEVKKEYKHVKW